jgi:hypothetical protein
MKKIIVPLLLLAFTGCATIVQSGPDHIPVDSKPQGANVYLDDNLVGTTPMVLAVPRDSDCRIRIEKDGYNPYSVDRDKVVAGWVFGNILIGGVIGLSVDLITHSQGKYPEDPVYVQMAAAPSDSRDPASVKK